jgi:DinB family protein
MDFLSESIARLSTTPVQLTNLVQGLSEEQLSWKPEAELFSVRENILHLRDIDVEGYAQRVRLILNEEHPALPDVDGAKLARERNYNAQPVQPALDDLRVSRAASVARLESCSVQDLDRQAEMQGVGTIDLRRLLEMWIEHDRGHIADAAEIRRSIETGSGPSFVQHQAA